VNTYRVQQARCEATGSDDLELVHASKNGDMAAFEELVRRYDRRLLRIAQNVMHNWEDAQDAVQEAFLKAFQHLGGFREDSQFSTWIIRITVNRCLMKLRQQKTRKEVSHDSSFESEEQSLPFDIADWTPNPEQSYRTSEFREILRKNLGGLPAGLRTVFVLRDVEEFSLEETAQVLRLTVATVKTRSRRARLMLRERLSKYFRRPREWSDRGSRLESRYFTTASSRD
jgi:RNA polymerase sigma-70 factor, ECF subfamily